MPAVTAAERPLSRRAVLAAVAVAAGTGAGVITGCTGTPESPPVDPDRQQLEAARTVETELMQVLRAATDVPEDALTAVEAHLTALDDALGDGESAAAPSPSPSATPPALTPLRAADRAADQHTRALRSASAAITPLLASIAASDAAIAAALRSGAA